MHQRKVSSISNLGTADSLQPSLQSSQNPFKKSQPEVLLSQASSTTKPGANPVEKKSEDVVFLKKSEKNDTVFLKPEEKKVAPRPNTQTDPKDTKKEPVETAEQKNLRKVDTKEPNNPQLQPQTNPKTVEIKNSSIPQNEPQKSEVTKAENLNSSDRQEIKKIDTPQTPPKLAQK